MKHLTLTERLALMHTPWAEHRERALRAVSAGTPMPDPFTRSPSPELVRAQQFAREHGIAIWDMYDIVGGKQRACLNWNAAKMYQRDKIHFTHEGYTLQGLLLHEAFIKAYNHYVATRLD